MKKVYAIALIIGFIMSGTVLAQKTHKGTLNIGPRLALGAVYGASVGFAGQVEYGLKDDVAKLGDGIETWLGIGASLAYSQYSEDYLLFASSGKFTYTNVVLLGSAFFHANVFKNPKLDTYLTFSIGANTGSVKYDGSAGRISTPSIGFLTIGAGAGARYYFSPKTAVVGEAGVGLGALRLGIDFLM